MANADPQKRENSLAAFKAAVDNGYAIECDLQISADGVPVVFHDDTLDRLTSETGPVRSRTAAPGLPVGLVAKGGLATTIRHLTIIIRHGFHFVSYSLTDLPTPAPLIARWILGLPLICWTVRSPQDARKAKRWTGQMTFEVIRP